MGRPRVSDEHKRLRKKTYLASYRKRDYVKARARIYIRTAAGRSTQLRALYGIDLEDWARLYNSQDGLCPGCEGKLAFDKSTHVDHCHSTRVVRGLLCRDCNIAVGNARENPDTLRRLAAYLERAK